MIYFSGTDDIPHRCERESAACKVVTQDPEFAKVGIEVDRCVLKDLRTVWAQGIRTECSCCGHGNGQAFICVAKEDAGKMRAMGYTEIPHRYAHCAECGVFFAPKEVS